MFCAKLFEFGALVGGQDIHYLFPALLPVGHGLANLVELLFLRIGQVQLSKHLLHVLATAISTAITITTTTIVTVVIIRFGTGGG